jgi:hypothetical protein
MGTGESFVPVGTGLGESTDPAEGGAMAIQSGRP